MISSSARLTHAHPLAVTGALVQGFALAYSIREKDFCSYKLLNYLASHPKIKKTIYVSILDKIEKALENELSPREVVKILGNDVLAEKSVPLALYAFLKWPDFAVNLCNTARLGGDTDTICAMSSALCGARFGIEVIPEKWISNLEQGPKGLSYIVSLADKLFEKFNQQTREI